MENVDDINDWLGVAQRYVARNATLYFCKSGIGVYRLLVPCVTKGGFPEIHELGLIFARLLGLQIVGSLEGCKYHIEIDRGDIPKAVHRFSMLLFGESCLSFDTHL